MLPCPVRARPRRRPPIALAALAILRLLLGLALATGTARAAESAPPALPVLPRASITAAELALLVAEGDPLSEAVALAYQQARGIPAANLVRVPVPSSGPNGGDSIRDSDFATLKAAIDARLPPGVQATLVTWLQPSRVQGERCAASITSALAFGYDPALCGGCARTRVSAYHDSDTTRPWTDLQIRPAMLLGAPTLAAAQALIRRGLAAEGSAPAGTGWLWRTADAARSVRWTDWPALPAAWAQPGGVLLQFVDASDPARPQALADRDDVLFYFTGAARVDRLDSLHFLPGALADHLTSHGGALPDGHGQMPATAWLAAGASASYGTVEEPCNHAEKFPRVSVLIEHYLRGATAIEAYWKSVLAPGQGLFVGDPLARPWGHTPSATIEDGAVVVRTRALRRLTRYAWEFQPAGGGPWRVLDSLAAGQPRPITWRVPLPPDAAGGRLRWVGPCPLQPARRCVLAGPA